MPTTILDNESYTDALQRRYAEETIAQDKIMRMAAEACSPHQILNTDLVFLKRFAALVAAHEREKLRCAIILNDDGGTYSTHESKKQLEWMLNMSPAKEIIEATVLAEREACAKVCDERSHRSDDMGAICAAAIRARSNP